MKKRICLFAGYHPKNQISDYVVYYLKALSEVADVYYMADCDIPASELEKLAPYTKGAWAFRHKKYDFGSWQELIQRIGWEALGRYEECLFVNDSTFGPIFPLAYVFEKADRQPQLGAWALNSFEGRHVGSFFFALRRPIFLSEAFKKFIAGISVQAYVGDVIDLYEKQLPRVFAQAGASYKVFKNTIPSVFDQWKTGVRQGFPVLKIQPFTRQRLYAQRQWLPGWRRFLAQYTPYPVTLMEEHFRSIGIDPNQFDRVSFRLKSVWWGLQRLRRRIFRIHFHKDERILVLFGICFMNTEPSGVNQVEEL